MPMATIAVVQAATPLFDTPATLARLRALVAEAAAQGATMALFPEGFVGGYPKGMDFGARLGGRTEAGRDQFRRYFESAIAVPGPETALIGELAAAHRMHLVVGAIERGGATLYCSVPFFGLDGALMGKHRKIMPTAMERILWGQGDGSTMPVIDTPFGRLGAVICWENYMPLLRTHMYAQGVEIWCAPTVDDRDTWALSMRHIAFEGRCYVASAVPYLTRSMLPEGYPGDVDQEVLIRGGSVIVGPMGDVLAGPLYGGEGVLVAEVDVATLPRAKYDFDVVGHYSRPDIFRLEVDTRDRGLR